MMSCGSKFSGPIAKRSNRVAGYVQNAVFSVCGSNTVSGTLCSQFVVQKFVRDTVLVEFWADRIVDIYKLIDDFWHIAGIRRRCG